MPESPLLSLDGIKMRVVETAANGVVGADTAFVFQQQGLIVTAHYAGGRIVPGFLAGVWDGTLRPYRYVQIADGGVLDCGRSVARVTRSLLRLAKYGDAKLGGRAGFSPPSAP